ncbi:MAG: DUF3795 domain-containing protein [Planctomycetota bacterium]|nr:DUF3795 domain-containing protein [Planctomycetota bacterium]
MDKRDPIIAACGMDCANECGIYRCPEDPGLLQKHIDWFKAMGWNEKDIKPESFRCGTCFGEINCHWSPDCEILACAKDKGVRYCNQCPEFPCDMLTQWAKGSPRYEDALRRLHFMNGTQSQDSQRATDADS